MYRSNGRSTERGQTTMTRPAPAKAHLDPNQPEAEAANLPNQSFVVRVCTSMGGFFIRVSSILAGADEYSHLPGQMRTTRPKRRRKPWIWVEKREQKCRDFQDHCCFEFQFGRRGLRQTASRQTSRCLYQTYCGS
jgi:hypothetical protein